MMDFDFQTYQAILPFFRSRRSALISRVPELIEGLDKSSRVLDLGCGDAALATTIAQSTGSRVWAVDPTRSAVVASRKRVSEAELENLIAVDQLDWKNALQTTGESKYDLIVASHLLYHIPKTEWINLYDHTKKHLSEGGKIVFITTSRNAQIHNAFWPHDRIESLIRRTNNLERQFGQYIFGEDFTKVLARKQVEIESRWESAEVHWPLSNTVLHIPRQRLTNDAWQLFFSFLYRLPAGVIKSYFGDKLDDLLQSASHNLKFTTCDVIHTVR